MTTPVQLAQQPLPDIVNGHRSVLWWGVALLILIESIVIAALVLSYFYIRLGVPDWPLGGISPPDLLIPTISHLILVAAVVPVYWADRAIRRDDTGPLRIGLPVALAFAFVSLGIKVYEMADLDYNWTTNAYGSLYWTMSGYSALHAVVVMLITGGVAVLAWQGYFSARRHVAVNITTLYWIFVAISATVLYLTVYISPYIRIGLGAFRSL